MLTLFFPINFYIFVYEHIVLLIFIKFEVKRCHVCKAKVAICTGSILKSQKQTRQSNYPSVYTMYNFITLQCVTAVLSGIK